MSGDRERYLQRLRRAAGGQDPDIVVGTVAAAVARHRGVPLDRAPLQGGAGGDVLEPPAHLAEPELLGQVYEALRPRQGRRAAGAFYTPVEVARPITATVLGPLTGHTQRVADPAVGGGAFLLAAARHLVSRGADPRAVVQRCLFGADVDPAAVAVTRTALALLADGTPPPASAIRVADALLDEAALPCGVDAVCGNPPFLNQLAAATARTAELRRALVDRFGAAAGGYADTANLFLLRALAVTRAGGRVGLILPDSFLVARDAGAARRAAAEAGGLEWLWFAGEKVFAAGVRVCAPVFAVGRPQGLVGRAVGPAFAAAPACPPPRPDLRDAPTWGALVADLLQVPAADHRAGGTLGDHCRATADFRDQYYGLVPFVFDDEGRAADEDRYPRLVTTGLIDPARSLWGRVHTRFAKRRFAHPRVDVEALRAGSALGRWSRARLVPKVLLATQTRVLEAAVDESGRWLPSTPTITVEAPQDRLWHVAAALTSPVLTAIALSRHAGAALSADAITVSARAVTALPAPLPGPSWDEGARALRQAAAATSEGGWRESLDACGRALCRAYAVDDAGDLVAWWRERLPPWRGAEG